MRTFIIAVTFLLTLASPAFAAKLLMWNPNTESDLAGYRVYVLREDLDTQVFDVGNVTSISFVDIFVPENKGYSFFVTAYDTSGNESDPSRIVTDKRTGPKITGGIKISE